MIRLQDNQVYDNLDQLMELPDEVFPVGDSKPRRLFPRESGCPHQGTGAEALQYLTDWIKEKNLGTSGVTVRASGKRIPSRRPTREDVNHYLSSPLSAGRQRKPTIGVAAAEAMPTSSLFRMIDTADRKSNTYSEGTYAQSGKYAVAFKDEPWGRIPKAGAYAEAGVGRAGAELSILEAEAKGPNVSAGAEVSALGAGAMARAEIGSVSANVGLAKVKLGLGVDTGVSVGVDGLEVKFLGTGFKIGPRIGISLFGSEVQCVIL